MQNLVVPYGDLLNNVSIVNSTLSQNSATECGGAIFIGALTTENNEKGYVVCFQY